MKGGIKAWNGEQVAGSKTKGLEYFLPKRGIEHGAQIAFAMEDGLKRLYEELKKRQSDPELEKLFKKLADFETQHKNRIKEFYKEITGRELEFPLYTPSTIIEGCNPLEEIIQSATEMVKSPQDLLDLASMLEAEAMDLYSRLSRRTELSKEEMRFFGWLKEEERGHLRLIDSIREGLE